MAMADDVPTDRASEREAGYQRWRAQIPFTDAQIAGALRQYADTLNPFLAHRWRWHADRLERTGNMSARVYCVALPYLVTVCAICGKKRCIGTRHRADAAPIG